MTSQSLRIVGVLDIKAGQIVRAVGGVRSSYRALQTACGSTDVLDVANAILSTGFCEELYVADLDALEGGRRQVEIVEALASLCPLAVDWGASRPHDLGKLPVGIRPVVALESWQDFSQLIDVIAHNPSAIFSLDLIQGQPRFARRVPTCGIDTIIEHVVKSGFRTVIVLDVATVGQPNSWPCGPICRELRKRYKSLTVWSGGGFTLDPASMQAAAASGLDAALIGSSIFEKAELRYVSDNPIETNDNRSLR